MNHTFYLGTESRLFQYKLQTKNFNFRPFYLLFHGTHLCTAVHPIIIALSLISTQNWIIHVSANKYTTGETESLFPMYIVQIPAWLNLTIPSIWAVSMGNYACVIHAMIWNKIICHFLKKVWYVFWIILSNIYTHKI